MKYSLEFDYKKAVQAINFFAKKEGGRIDKIRAIKLIYFADRFHLRKYGRPVVNDTYWAMPYGPVGSTLKDIAEMSHFLAEEELRYASEYVKQGDGFSLVSEKDIDDEVFSDSDLEALEFSHDNFGDKKTFNLVDITHKYPEWMKFETALDNRETTREQMSYSDFFLNPDPETLKKDPFALSSEDLANSCAIFEESCRIANRWYA